MAKSEKAGLGKIIFNRPNETTLVYTKYPRLRVLYPPHLAN
jgi:hypothetical protein